MEIHLLASRCRRHGKAACLAIGQQHVHVLTRHEVQPGIRQRQRQMNDVFGNRFDALHGGRQAARFGKHLPAAGHADADHRRLADVGTVGGRRQEVPEQLAVQGAEAVRNAEGGLALVAGRQHHAEVVIAHVGREVVADDAFGARAARPRNGRHWGCPNGPGR
ncbi:hypothetical protein G6F59_016318 [Rhizopus arrhizus]|nr:hypothetical protein G6F59_016318 [Rhizopus arrhizus]